MVFGLCLFRHVRILWDSHISQSVDIECDSMAYNYITFLNVTRILGSFLWYKGMIYLRHSASCVVAVLTWFVCIIYVEVMQRWSVHVNCDSPDNTLENEQEKSLLSYFYGSLVLHTLQHRGTDQIECIVSQLHLARYLLWV